MFRSNEKISGRGFKARWTMNCGGTFVADTQEKYIVSPDYPNEYSGKLYCKYTILSGKKNVNIRFDDFALEKGPSGCLFDNLTISTSSKSTHYWLGYMPALKVFCGTTTPPPYRVNEDVTITFQTDSFVNRRGFKFAYFLDSMYYNCQCLFVRFMLFCVDLSVGMCDCSFVESKLRT